VAGVLFLLPLRKAPAAALFGITLAPLLLGIWEAGLDLYAFGYAIMEVGLKKAFDAQVAGAMPRACCSRRTPCAVPPALRLRNRTLLPEKSSIKQENGWQSLKNSMYNMYIRLYTYT
jgi:hypothetical protein